MYTVAQSKFKREKTHTKENKIESSYAYFRLSLNQSQNISLVCFRKEISLSGKLWVTT